MKTYTKTIWNICACMLIILLGGCADDDIIRKRLRIDLARDRISSNKHVSPCRKAKLPYKIRENRSFSS